MALTSGTKIATYEILHPIGAGGMGEVYEANDSRLRRRVAIKIVSKAFSNDRDAIALFEREAQILASISHPNIATIYGFEETPSGFAIVMELVPGTDLAEHIRAAAPLPLDEATAIALQVCEGLEAAHDRGVIHRDLKPANIKLTPDGTVKILDFGLARSAPAPTDVSDSPTEITLGGSGTVIGTAPYISPEQANAKPADARTDLWA